MSNSLRFILNPGPTKCVEPLDRWSDLVLRQEASLRSAFSLTIYRCPDRWAGSLQDLLDGDALNDSGQDPFDLLIESQQPASDQPDKDPSESDQPAGTRHRRLVCKALIPVFDPANQWLEVYELEAPHSPDSPARRLDSLPLQEATNETCWFYPTEDGRYLSWESQQAISCHPGHVYEQLPDGQNHGYDRAGLRILWSLMADQSSLTCVGLTYQRKRIDFPLLASSPGTTTTWTSFLVDSMSDSPLQKQASLVI